MALSSRITQHRSYLRAVGLAAAYLRNPTRLSKLIEQARRKAETGSGSYLASIGESLGIPLRMLMAYLKGDYREIPWRSLSLITAAVVYFVMPMDLLPDVLPLLGFMDDVALLTWTLSQIKSDIDRFLCWEREQLPPAQIAGNVEAEQAAELGAPES